MGIEDYFPAYKREERGSLILAVNRGEQGGGCNMQLDQIVIYDREGNEVRTCCLPTGEVIKEARRLINTLEERGYNFVYYKLPEV